MTPNEIAMRGPRKRPASSGIIRNQIAKTTSVPPPYDAGITISAMPVRRTVSAPYSTEPVFLINSGAPRKPAMPIAKRSQRTGPPAPRFDNV